MNKAAITETLRSLTGADPVCWLPLGGGCVGEVAKVGLSNGKTLIVKSGKTGSGLDIEGYMLRYLKDQSDLPVPSVLHAADELLVMSYIHTSGRLNASAQAHAADLLAALHAMTGPAYGLDRDTLIGGLHQPNPATDSWIEFFRDHRLLYMAEQAEQAVRLPRRVRARVEKLCEHLDRWLTEPDAPRLIHGDVWSGNVLCGKDGKIAGFVDPAIYYADPEIELAFSTLFNTFGAPFFARYQQLRPIAPGFFEERRDLYNLYPLLVHVRLFGGSYVTSVENSLARFGF
ncbi:MAG: fructosamine kinase family protein [Magnetospiraceae bacterium]